MNSITKDFENHANRIASGFAAMSPEPTRRAFNPHQAMNPPHRQKKPQTASFAASPALSVNLNSAGNSKPTLKP
jgi:hypothetical protein